MTKNVSLNVVGKFLESVNQRLLLFRRGLSAHTKNSNFYPKEKQTTLNQHYLKSNIIFINTNAVWLNFALVWSYKVIQSNEHIMQIIFKKECKDVWSQFIIYTNVILYHSDIVWGPYNGIDKYNLLQL